MNTLDKERVELIVSKSTKCVLDLVPTMQKERAKAVASDIFALIDWTNEALMHKGFSWMAERYLIVQKML